MADFDLDDRLIMLNVTDIVSAFLGRHLPEREPETYLTPHLPLGLQTQITKRSDLLNSDLYVNLRVLIGNDRYFRQVGVYEGPVINQCARLTLNFRNRIAHQNLNELIPLEQLQLDYLSINRLISLLPVSASKQTVIEETRSYIGSGLLFITKEYVNSEISLNSKFEVHKRTEQSLNNNEVINYEDDERDIVSRTEVKLTTSECKQKLRRLRQQINDDIGNIPYWGNILRESILNKMIDNKVCNEEQLRQALTKVEFAKTDESQFQYFDKISDIISRL